MDFKNTSTKEKIFLGAIVLAFAAILYNWKKIFQSLENMLNSQKK